MIDFADALAEARNATCYFHGWPDAGPCDGRLIAAHLLPRAKLKREYPHGVLLEDDRWRRKDRNEDRYDLPYRTLRELHDDKRGWVPCCGGPMGLSGHHGALDVSRRTVRVSWEQLPEGTIEFATELGLLPWLERTYPKQNGPACG